MAQPEARLSTKIVKWLNEQPGVIARKRHGSAYGTTDVDIYGCVNGRHFEIEVKVGDNKPTKLQEKRLEQWAAVGAITGVAWSLDEVKELMRPYINPPDINVNECEIQPYYYLGRWIGE